MNVKKKEASVTKINTVATSNFQHEKTSGLFDLRRAHPPKYKIGHVIKILYPLGPGIELQ